VFFMVSETSCDELRRVAASRFFKALIYDAKVQKILETTKHFLNFFRKKYTKGTVPFVYSKLECIAAPFVKKQSPGFLASPGDCCFL
jgi:hypothetical protein